MDNYNYEKEFQKDNPYAKDADNKNNEKEILPNPGNKKKNRTLQYYKFLHYSMKLEIKIHEFIDVVRFSNQSEISLWILSIVLYFNSPNNYSNYLVWFHLFHVLRGIFGMIIMLKLPRTYNIVESMNVDNTQMETMLFNDIVRDVVNREVVEKLKNIKKSLIFYFVLTFINLTIDTIDFFICLTNVEKTDISNNYKIIYLTFLIISFLYLGINYFYISY
jgi:hypothetical protein